MRTMGLLLIGFALGLAAENATIVPHGNNTGFYVGAVLVFIGGVLYSTSINRSER